VCFKISYNHLVNNQIISYFQSGFTKGDSTVNHLVDITNDFYKALDDGKEIRVAFFYISKAFDSLA